MAKATSWEHNGGWEIDVEHTDREQEIIDEWEFTLDLLIDDPNQVTKTKATDAIEKSQTEPVDFYCIDDKVLDTIKKMRAEAKYLLSLEEPEEGDLDKANRLLACVNDLLHHVPVERRREAA